MKTGNKLFSVPCFGM